MASGLEAPAQMVGRSTCMMMMMVMMVRMMMNIVLVVMDILIYVPNSTLPGDRAVPDPSRSSPFALARTHLRGLPARFTWKVLPSECLA